MANGSSETQTTQSPSKASPALVSRSTQVTRDSNSVLSAQLIVQKRGTDGENTRNEETEDALLVHRRSHVSLVEFDTTVIPPPPTGGAAKKGFLKRTLSDHYRLHTLKSVQQLHRLDSFRRAAREFETSPDCAPGDVHKLLHLFILRRPLLWRSFVTSFIFRRVDELKQVLSSSPCKHLILR